MRGLAESFPQPANYVTVGLENQLVGRSYPKNVRNHRSTNKKSISFENLPKCGFPRVSDACWSLPTKKLMLARTFFMEAWSAQLAPTWEIDACKDMFNGSLTPSTNKKTTTTNKTQQKTTNHKAHKNIKQIFKKFTKRQTKAIEKAKKANRGNTMQPNTI